MKKNDKMCRRVVVPRNPISDVMGEPIARGAGARVQSMSEFLRYGLLRQALDGKKKALLSTLKECADREIKLMAKGRYKQAVLYEQPNLEYERIGEVAALLGIARPYPAPPIAKRHPLEREDRFQLLKWVILPAVDLGTCSYEHVDHIREWERRGYPQWRNWRGCPEFPEPIIDEYFDEEKGEYVPFAPPISVPPQAVPQAKRSIHPFDKKIWYPRDGMMVRMPVIEVLILNARKYVATHPNDTDLAIELLKIENRMEAAREAQGGLRDYGADPLQHYTKFAVSNLEDALIGLGGAEIRFPYRAYARAVLKPWLVQAALDRLKNCQFTLVEQMLIVTRTLNSEQVIWPEWWELDWYPKRAPS